MFTKKSFLTFLYIGIIIGVLSFVFFTSEHTAKVFFLSILISMMYTLIYGAGNGLMNDYLNRIFPWNTETRKRVISGIIGTFVVNVLLTYLCTYINFILIQGQPTENLWNGKLNVSIWIFINIALMVSAVLHAKSFMEEWKKSTRKEVVEQKIIAKSANAQFESLKNQLDPHFLFNSLNVLDALIEENPHQAQKFTNDMSKIYRYVLDQKDKEKVTVQEELDFAKTYCELLKTRFEDSVNFEFDVQDSEKEKFVVPLSLQLLLENAIKHNYATPKKPLKVRIFSENNFLCIENNLQARDLVKEREGIGLSNIVQRYSIITKENVFIEKSDDYFKVKIPILTQKITHMETYKTNNENLAYERAYKRVKEIKGFYGNLISYCLVMPFLIFINLKTAPEYHWFWWPMLGWGIGVISHGLQVFGIGKNWEEKKIKELMEKDQF
ncbi:2TM domain-containing protein [Weeksellaceae bacterium A-14]|uniref:2TM domain-containing protein n=1 Tax=Daejeonia sp. YH14 TaxID=3439042 RepID=UPI0031E4BB0A